MATKFNLQAVFINHNEKIIAGLVALLALYGFWSASWEHADVMPAQLIQQASAVRAQIESQTTWPPEHRKTFTENMPNIARLASDLGKRDDIDHTRFNMPIEWNEQLMPALSKRATVEVVAPTHPEAVAVDIPLAFPPDEDELNDDESDEFLANKNKDPRNKTKKVDLTRAKAAQQFGGNDGSEELEKAALAATLTPEEQMVGTYGMTLEQVQAMMGNQGGLAVTAEQNRPTARRKVQWEAGISVRMIVDIQEQRKKLRDALHITGSYADIQSYIDYQEMVIQRQAYDDGQWRGWNTIPIEDIGEILLRTMGQNIDIVSPAVTCPELTMPLPRRATGTWQTSEAAHPMITDFKLSPEEQAMQDRIDAILSEEALQAQLDAPPQRKARKQFLPYFQSRNQLGSQALNNYASPGEFQAGAMAQIQQSYNRRGETFDENSKAIFNKQFEETATADFRLYLVRFIDFTANRGIKYRYRVRLNMYNPNFQELADDLVSPETAQEEIIESAWSEPTSEVMVPMKYSNFARKVKASRKTGQHSVDFNVYYKDDGVLPVMGSVTVDVGMPIAGHERTERVDLELGILEGGEVNFSTDELLCGVVPGVRTNRQDFNDVKEIISEFDNYQYVFAESKTDTQGAKEEILKIFHEKQLVEPLVTLVDASGDIVLRYANENSYREKRDLVDAIVSNFEDWREQKEIGLQIDDDDDEDEEEMDVHSGGGGRGMQRGSALRLRR
ncbi:MAG: hypothetical protein MK102_03220 [Fuerstiella sp.]|nr:hypothetical protein [Fuerstiella sp.]